MMRRLHLLLLTAVALVVVWIVSPHEALSHGAVTTTVYFDREIVRILNNRCVMCHMDGGLSFPLDGFQNEAMDAVDAGHSVLVAAPTGSGKTLVAEYAIEVALAAGGKAFYTTPLKALSNQKFNDLVARHGADKVGLLTGDTVINPDAPVAVLPADRAAEALQNGPVDVMIALHHLLIVTFVVDVEQRHDVRVAVADMTKNGHGHALAPEQVFQVADELADARRRDDDIIYEIDRLLARIEAIQRGIQGLPGLP